MNNKNISKLKKIIPISFIVVFATFLANLILAYTEVKKTHDLLPKQKIEESLPAQLNL